MADAIEALNLAAAVENRFDEGPVNLDWRIEIT